MVCYWPGVPTEDGLAAKWTACSGQAREIRGLRISKADRRTLRPAHRKDEKVFELQRAHDGSPRRISAPSPTVFPGSAGLRIMQHAPLPMARGQEYRSRHICSPQYPGIVPVLQCSLLGVINIHIFIFLGHLFAHCGEIKPPLALRMDVLSMPGSPSMSSPSSSSSSVKASSLRSNSPWDNISKIIPNASIPGPTDVPDFLLVKDRFQSQSIGSILFVFIFRFGEVGRSIRLMF